MDEFKLKAINIKLKEAGIKKIFIVEDTDRWLGFVYIYEYEEMPLLQYEYFALRSMKLQMHEIIEAFKRGKNNAIDKVKSLMEATATMQKDKIYQNKLVIYLREQESMFYDITGRLLEKETMEEKIKTEEALKEMIKNGMSSEAIIRQSVKKREGDLRDLIKENVSR